MIKEKAPQRIAQVRLPKPMYERLLRLRNDRSIREGRPVSLNALLIEAVEQVFGKVA